VPNQVITSRMSLRPGRFSMTMSGGGAKERFYSGQRRSQQVWAVELVVIALCASLAGSPAGMASRLDDRGTARVHVVVEVEAQRQDRDPSVQRA
jgi:hypothetical protein